MWEPTSREAAERLRLALDLFAAAEAMMRQNLRRRFPDASAEEIEARIAAWLSRRPEGDAGDAADRPAGSPRAK